MTTLFRDVLNAGDLTSQQGVLLPAAQAWNAGRIDAEKKAGDALTEMLTAIYAFGCAALDNPNGLKNLAWDCQITIPGDKSSVNVWNPLIKLATGQFVPGQTVVRKDPNNKNYDLTRDKFVGGERLIKYAAALRWLHQQGVDPADVADTVAAFTFVNGSYTAGSWNGIVAHDRHERKEAGTATARQMHDTDKLQMAALALLEKSSLPAAIKDSAKVDAPEFGLVWGYWVDGNFVVGERVEGATFTAKAKTLAVQFADAVESAETDIKEAA